MCTGTAAVAIIDVTIVVFVVVDVTEITRNWSDGVSTVFQG